MRSWQGTVQSIEEACCSYLRWIKRWNQKYTVKWHQKRRKRALRTCGRCWGDMSWCENLSSQPKRRWMKVTWQPLLNKWTMIMTRLRVRPLKRMSYSTDCHGTCTIKNRSLFNSGKSLWAFRSSSLSSWFHSLWRLMDSTMPLYRQQSGMSTSPSRSSGISTWS